SQNPFAPAALGSALLTGPTWSRYRDLYDRLNHRTALEIVAGSQSLARAVVQTLPPDRAAMLAHAAWDVSTEGAKVADDAVRATSALFDKQLDLDEAA
ncbi:MAG: 3-deoxy-D-manno-octulosonic acid transferase, partial [Pseudomonadota bacterium]